MITFCYNAVCAFHKNGPLHRFCPPVHRAARPYGLCVLYDTAARVSKICNLRIEDVRFENPPHIRIMGKGMKVRAVPILPATAKNEKTPQPMGNWLRGNGKHSENSRKKLKIPLKNCKTGRQGRENAHQAAQQKKPNRLKMVGHLYKTHLENRSSTSLVLCDTTKTRACDILYVTGFWCA